MSDTFRRRRRHTHTGPSSARYRAMGMVPIEQVKPAAVGKAETAACAAVAIVALALIVLIWIVTQRAIQDDRAEIRYRAERNLIGQAATIAETVTKELLVIDQSLAVIQDAWRHDSNAVDLAKWQQHFPALMSVAEDLFISDENHIVRQDILPKAIGQGVGSAYVTFPHGSLEAFESDGTKDKEALLLQGTTGAPIDVREFLMYIIRPLDHPKGWLIGASYRSAELTKLFAGASLGFNPMIALVETRHGMLQAVVGPAARRPKVDLSQSPLFVLMSRAPSGTWEGATAVDGVERVHAFHEVPGRDMAVVAAVAVKEVMAPADNLAASARGVASAASVLVLVIGGLVLWALYTVRAHGRRRRTLERNRVELERLRQDDANTSARALANAERLHVVLDNVQDGIALFDAPLRLVQWNRPFQDGIGIEPRREMSLETLIREQIATGRFGTFAHPDSEVARWIALLCSGDPAGLPQANSNSAPLVLRGLPVADGGIILLLTDLVQWERRRADASPAGSVESAGQPAAPASAGSAG